VNPRTDMLEPMQTKSKIDKLLPKLETPYTEIELPMRMKLLTERQLPKLAKSNVDRQLANLTTPNTDMELPKRA
jgi:hypothetical protein